MATANCRRRKSDGHRNSLAAVPVDFLEDSDAVAPVAVSVAAEEGLEDELEDLNLALGEAVADSHDPDLTQGVCNDNS